MIPEASGPAGNTPIPDFEACSMCGFDLGADAINLFCREVGAPEEANGAFEGDGGVV